MGNVPCLGCNDAVEVTEDVWASFATPVALCSRCKDMSPELVRSLFLLRSQQFSMWQEIEAMKHRLEQLSIAQGELEQGLYQ